MIFGESSVYKRYKAYWFTIDNGLIKDNEVDSTYHKNFNIDYAQSSVLKTKLFKAYTNKLNTDSIVIDTPDENVESLIDSTMLNKIVNIYISDGRASTFETSNIPSIGAVADDILCFNIPYKSGFEGEMVFYNGTVASHTNKIYSNDVNKNCFITLFYNGSSWILNSFSTNTYDADFSFEGIEKIGKIESGATISTTNGDELEASEGDISIIEKTISMSLNDISVTPEKVNYYRDFFNSSNKFAILEEDVEDISRSMIYHEIDIVSSMIFNSNDVSRITLSAEKKATVPTKYMDNLY